MPKPSSTPPTTLKRSPPRARPSETPRCRPSSPDTIRSARATHTDETAGRTCARITPLRVAASHAASTTAIGATAMSACRTLANVITRRFVVLEHLLAHVQPHAIAEPRELGRRHDLLPVARAIEI